jgi:hypothetical protein
MKREEKIEKSLRFWQRFLNLGSWQIDFKIKKFKRKDFVQSGDIEVDIKNKKASVLICDTKTGRDDYIILHELIHLVLWEYDHFVEDNISDDKKDQYFELLENIAKDLTDIIHMADSEKNDRNTPTVWKQ